jgi:threonine dehydratase
LASAAASLLGVKATVVMPTDTAVKESAIRGYGAEVVKVGTTSEERLRWAERAARDGLLEIPVRPPGRDRGAGNVREGNP